MLTELKDQVIETLKFDRHCRNSDIYLMITLWKRYFASKLGQDCVPLQNLYDLPREDHIKRIRAKLQEEALERINTGKVRGDEHYFIPSLPEVAKQRQISAEVWKKCLGYFVSFSAGQTEQLPRPVGQTGFEVIDNWHFVAHGAYGKRYKVKNEMGFWHCECDDFRFHTRDSVYQCKHIKAIILWQKKRDAADAAKNQKPLF